MSFDLKSYLLLKQMDGTSGTINDGATSWNDLTDKPFETETTLVKFFPETTMISAAGEFSTEFSTEFNGEFIVGEKYVVTLVDGGSTYSFKSVAKSAIVNGAVIPYIGNARLFDSSFADTGEYYIIGIMQGYLTIGFAEAALSPITLAIQKVEETIHPLDVKYLPEGGFGYTDYEVLLPETEVTLADRYIESEGVINHLIGFDLGKKYRIMLDGVAYECVTIGDETLVGVQFEVDDYKVSIYDVIDSGKCGIVSGVGYAGTHTLSVLGAEKTHIIAPKYLPEGGVGYTFENVEEIKLFFDGIIGDRENVYLEDGISAVKISDNTPIINELIGGTITVNPFNQGDITFQITEDNIENVVVEGLPVFTITIPETTLFVAIVMEECDFEGVHLTKGIWCLASFNVTKPEDTVTYEITYNGKVEKINKIDGKFLY